MHHCPTVQQCFLKRRAVASHAQANIAATEHVSREQKTHAAPSTPPIPQGQGLQCHAHSCVFRARRWQRRAHNGLHASRHHPQARQGCCVPSGPDSFRPQPTYPGCMDFDAQRRARPSTRHAIYETLGGKPSAAGTGRRLRKHWRGSAAAQPGRSGYMPSAAALWCPFASPVMSEATCPARPRCGGRSPARWSAGRRRGRAARAPGTPHRSRWGPG